MQGDQSKSFFSSVKQRRIMCMRICKHCWKTGGREISKTAISAMFLLQNIYTVLKSLSSLLTSL